MKSYSKIVIFGAAFCFGSAGLADSIQATFEGAGVQLPAAISICQSSSPCIIGNEDFDAWTGGAFSTDYGTGNQITGDYSGGFVSLNADQYGGAGGTGRYPELYPDGGAYSVSFTTAAGVPGVNYFGLWFPALDGGSTLEFYDGSTLVDTFTPGDYMNMVGWCPSATNGFCGNPNPNFKGQDSGEQFAYLNFYNLNGYFTKVVFSEPYGGGFESDNQSAGYLATSTLNGTLVVPEPANLGLAMIGMLLIGAGAAGRRRSSSR